MWNAQIKKTEENRKNLLENYKIRLKNISQNNKLLEINNNNKNIKCYSRFRGFKTVKQFKKFKILWYYDSISIRFFSNFHWNFNWNWTFGGKKYVAIVSVSVSRLIAGLTLIQ